MPMFKRMLLIAGASVAVIAAGAPAGAEPLIAGKEFLPDQYIARITAGMNGLAKMDSSDTAEVFTGSWICGRHPIQSCLCVSWAAAMS